MPPASGFMSMIRRSSSGDTNNNDGEAPSHHHGNNTKIQMSGWLRKQSETLKAWRRRYFTLTGTLLAYYESENIQGASPKGVMRITDVLPLTSNENGLLLQLSNGKTVKLVADTKVVYNAWFSVISVALRKGKVADVQQSGKSGWAHYRIAEGDWTRYFVVLKDYTISMYSSSDPDATLELSGIVRTVSLWEGKKFGLIIGINKKRRMQVCFDTVEERNTWMLTLEMAISSAPSVNQIKESSRRVDKVGRMTEPPTSSRSKGRTQKMGRKTDPASADVVSPSQDKGRATTEAACGVWI